MYGLEAFGNWLHTLWFVYFWESLKGNGPEDLFHLAVLGLVGWLIGKGSKKLVTEWRHHRSVHAKKLDHIILNHPDIPNTVPGLLDEHQPRL